MHLAIRLRRSCLLVSFFAALSAGLALAATPGFKAGAFAQEITPTKFPSPINGSMKGNFAQGVTDPMYARAFALHDGSTTLIFCMVDACAVPREICDAAKAIVSQATGVPASHLMIAATHSHSCATMTGLFQSEPDPSYVAEVPERIAQALIRAHANLEPAGIAWGKDTDPTQVFNRRWFMQAGETYENPFAGAGDRALMNPGHKNAKVSKPTGPVDPEVNILAARAKADGRPIALLANYSLHYVGGLPAISADYFGAFAREIARRLETTDARYAGRPAFVAMMSNGTSGNINNVNFAAGAPPRRQPGAQIEAVTQSVSDAAMRAWEKLSWHANAPLASRERELTLGVRKPDATELERARKIMAETPRDNDGQFTDRKAIYARETLLLDAYPASVPLKLQVHRIGGLTIAAIPCEVFVEIGLELKAAKPLEEHFTVSLANGYNGYLPTPEHHRLGGYETWRARSSYLEIAAAPAITEALNEIAAEFAK